MSEFVPHFEFNRLICEALGVDVTHVARYSIVGTGEDVYVEIEWIPEFVAPGDPMTGRFRLQATDDAVHLHGPAAGLRTEVLGHE